MTATERRIRSRWDRALPPLLRGGKNSDSSVTIHRLSDGTPDSTYSGAEITNVSTDFLGDWRASDSWKRFDLWRVRNRSRQLERGDPLCIAFKRNMLNNVLGARGLHFKPDVRTSKAFGDATEGEADDMASSVIKAALDEFGKPLNFTTRKKLSRRDSDRLLLSRLIFDGEFIAVKRRGFAANDFKFAWQFLNPDYLDQNLNRIEDNGNITRMGVELDATDKFPVAYWFLRRRPNDFQYAWMDQYSQQRYYRVPAEEVIHVFLQTEDEEETRGWPWVFAAAVVLFRLGKFAEAALVNAAIGASNGVYFKKALPEGFSGDPKELWQDGQTIPLDLPAGGALELPVGVEAQTVNMQYPSEVFGSFMSAMSLTAGSVFGTSYATTTGDLSKANFVSSRLGQQDEREHFRACMQFFIEHWKEPAHDEEVYRGILAGKIKLPLTKFEKFSKAVFRGRGFQFVQPVDDWKAKEIAMDNVAADLGDIIEETTGEDREDMFRKISQTNKLLEKYGLQRKSSQAVIPADGNAAGDNPNNPVEPDAPAKD